MRTYSFLIALITMISVTVVKAQEPRIWKGDLNTKDLKAFSVGKYTSVAGTITIENYKGNDLKVLKRLQKCTGSIRILGNKKLTSLNGLEYLEFVGGKFSILDNPELYSYCALQKKLIYQGIQGVEISEGIIEKLETEDNGYNPSIMSLRNKNCKGYKMPDFCFSC